VRKILSNGSGKDDSAVAMAVGTVRTFHCAESAEAAYLAVGARLWPTGGHPFKVRERRIEFDQLWVSRVEESGPLVRQVELRPQRAHITFLMLPQPLAGDGMKIPFNSVVRHGNECRYYERSFGPLQWGTVSLPAEAFVLAGIALGDCDLTPPSNAVIVHPELPAMRTLRKLCAAVADLAKDAPGLLANSELARGLEQTLIGAIVGCLSPHDISVSTAAHRRHRRIMNRFHQILDTNPDRALFLPEMCAALHVPERTLRLCCHEMLGMGPIRYLRLRRMRLAHRALRRAGPDTTSVTEVATRFGFWHFGRFATTYRSLFGEAPSATLTNSSAG
jgi:AraC-like DNA-binding protein